MMRLAHSASGKLFLPEPEDEVDGLSGLPTQELTEAGVHPREVFIESLQMWFDVRSRYLQWTDGRLAQMLIATDVTARRRVEELAQQQAEKVLHAFQPGVTAHPMRRPVKIQSDREQRPRQQRRQTR